jgi:starch synthase
VNILLATSEAVPFAKTGGLADVCGALPIELARLGHRPALILPAYRQTQQCGLPLEPLGIELAIPVGNKTVIGRLLKSRLPELDVPVYLVQQDHYYDRSDLYTVDGKDYIDNCERFVFFCRAVLETMRVLDLRVDVLHANDWQTGLLPAYLKIEHPDWSTASLLTIHNMSYQGSFWHWDMLLTGLDWKYFNWREMECHGRLNLLKTGLIFADSINSVSPRYSQEIQKAPLGCGLEGVLQYRRDVVSGITNGIDARHWDPSTDPHLPANYGADTVIEGKAVCKAALQREVRLPVEPDVPLVGLIGRLTNQKGFDLVAEVMQRWLGEREVQWCILGTGQPAYHHLFEALAERFPRKLAISLKFSEPLAHRIEAGADVFLMPSRFEPCGLNQLYSLRYGAVPVVHATGGLADTIADVDDPASGAAANGFCFAEYNAAAMEAALARACDRCRQRDARRQLIQAGMRQDWSWARSAREYVALYEKTIARARTAAGK